MTEALSEVLGVLVGTLMLVEVRLVDGDTTGVATLLRVAVVKVGVDDVEVDVGELTLLVLVMRTRKPF